MICVSTPIADTSSKRTTEALQSLRNGRNVNKLTHQADTKMPE
jgi:hypothetical protein